MLQSIDDYTLPYWRQGGTTVNVCQYDAPKDEHDLAGAVPSMKVDGGAKEMRFVSKAHFGFIVAYLSETWLWALS